MTTKPSYASALARPVLVALAVLSLAGCATLAYYAQSVHGQAEVLEKRRAIADVLADPQTTPRLRQRLELAQRIRDFATTRLALPDNGSYRSYTDLQRPFVAWNVFATPEFSLEPLRWCFPLAGCFSYRGYFSRHDAAQFAARLQTGGYDVFIAPVPAYSTLGWFDDPLLNTMMHWPEPEFAGLLFHELAHQQLYVKGDSAFNESFATTVEREGVRRWMRAEARSGPYQRYLQRRGREAQLIQLALHTRQRLAALYGSDRPAPELRAGKRRIFADMQAGYAALRREWGGYDRYDAWMAQGLNNAQLASVATYHQYVPAFRAILAYNGGDLPAFYAAAARLAAMPRPERSAYLQTLLRQTEQAQISPVCDAAQ